MYDTRCMIISTLFHAVNKSAFLVKSKLPVNHRAQFSLVVHRGNAVYLQDVHFVHNIILCIYHL